MHAESLPYDWWKNPLPDTLGDRRIYVLTVEEMKRYGEVLDGMKAAIEREQAIMRGTLKQLASPKRELPSWLMPHGAPRMTTLAHVLEFQVTMAKSKLALMKLLLAMSGERVKRFGPRTKQGDDNARPDRADRSAE